LWYYFTDNGLIIFLTGKTMSPNTKPIYDLLMQTLHAAVTERLALSVAEVSRSAADAARRSLSPNEDRSLSRPLSEAEREAEGTAIDLLQSLSREVTDGEISQFYVAIEEQTKELIEIGKRIQVNNNILGKMIQKTAQAVVGLVAGG
jgi:hypothetical protein